MSGQTDYKELEELARRGRWLVISTVAGSGAGHVGGPFSAMDLMVALYFRVMKVRPEEPQWPERDRFILSKGHSAIGQYTVMALRGYLPVEELKTFDKGSSRLQGHPDVTKLPAWRLRPDLWVKDCPLGLDSPWAVGCGGRSFIPLS